LLSNKTVILVLPPPRRRKNSRSDVVIQVYTALKPPVEAILEGYGWDYT